MRTLIILAAVSIFSSIASANASSPIMTCYTKAAQPIPGITYAVEFVRLTSDENGQMTLKFRKTFWGDEPQDQQNVRVSTTDHKITEIANSNFVVEIEANQSGSVSCGVRPSQPCRKALYKDAQRTVEIGCNN